MFKKIAIGLLVVTVLGAGGAAAAYQASTTEESSATSTPINTSQSHTQAEGNPAAGQQSNEPAIVAEGSLGEPWFETGTITEIDDTGFQFALPNNESVYIELGPAEYWQNQGILLESGKIVTVDGSINEGMIHATQVILADGQILQVRSETGQPLWSGGVDNQQGQNGQQNGEPQVQVDEWVTLEGTLMSFQGGNMTMSTIDGEIISFKTGQPRFFAEQGVTFQVGEEVVIVGFYKGEQFQAGDITQVSTGARVMLLDPNGRPLWAGPGNGQGNGGN